LSDINNTAIDLPSNNQELIVGVRVSGSAKNPHFTLYSKPSSLSQGDILSYLLFDRPLAQATNADAGTLFSAVNVLGAGDSQFAKIHEQLQHLFFLDSVRIESSSLPNANTSDINKAPNYAQNTSLVLEKMLSPRLLVNYSVGLLVPTHILKVRYLLTKSWALQTETSNNGSGIDLYYSIETQ
jgi:autotransporter translocation and assembly factor TamB